MLAVAGSVIGTMVGVITLFAVLYTDVPRWMVVWTAACATLLTASGVWAWQRPRDVGKALHLGAATAIAGLGSSMPALLLWLEHGAAAAGMPRTEIATVGAALAALCACYLAFAAADLLRAAGLEAQTHGTR